MWTLNSSEYLFHSASLGSTSIPPWISGSRAPPPGVGGWVRGGPMVPCPCPCHSHDHLLPMQDRDLTGLPYADRLAYEYGITISDLGAARWLNREYPPAVIQTREYRSPEVPDADDPTVFRHLTTILAFSPPEYSGF